MDKPVIQHILVVNFHHEKGNEVEWSYPSTSEIDPAVREEITAKAMPDQAHKYDTDYCYFNAGAYNCFQQVPANAVVDAQATRSMVQKSVVVLSSKPFYGAIRHMLEPLTRAYFSSGQSDKNQNLTQAGVFADRAILEVGFQMFNKKFNSLSTTNQAALYAGLELQDLVLNFGRETMVLFKNQFLEKKTIFYGTPASYVSDTIVCLASLMPCYLPSLAGSHILTEVQQKEAALFGFPLQCFDKTHLDPYCTLSSGETLAAKDSFIIGSSNPMFALGNTLKADLIVDLTDLSLAWKNQGLASNCGLSNEDEKFIDHVYEQVAACKEAEPGFLQYEGSNEWIRDMFLQYTKTLVSCSADASIRKSGEKLTPFNSRWCAQWRITENYKHFTTTADKPAIVAYCPPEHASTSLPTFVDRLAGAIGELGQAYDNYQFTDPNSPGVIASAVAEIGQAYDKFQFSDPNAPGVLDNVVAAVKEAFVEEKKPATTTPAPSTSTDQPPPQAAKPAEESSFFGGFFNEAPQARNRKSSVAGALETIGDSFDSLSKEVRSGLQKFLANDFNNLGKEGKESGVDLDTLLSQQAAPAAPPADPQ